MREIPRTKNFSVYLLKIVFKEIVGEIHMKHESVCCELVMAFTSVHNLLS